jgi:hypothetical protein
MIILSICGLHNTVSKNKTLKNYVSRCTIINVDPETAVRDPELEPLRTLRS